MEGKQKTSSNSDLATKEMLFNARVKGTFLSHFSFLVPHISQLFSLCSLWWNPFPNLPSPLELSLLSFLLSKNIGHAFAMHQAL